MIASRQLRISNPVRDGLPQGFTLIELLAVIAIIGVLAALVLGALRGAQQDALVAKTRATISKIDAVLSERMDDYFTRSLDFVGDSFANNFYVRERFPVENVRRAPFAQRLQDPNWPIVPGRTSPPFAATNVPAVGLLRERLRIAAIRDLMRLEMPDGVGDLFINGFARNAPPTLNAPVVLATGFREGPVASQPIAPVVQQLEVPTDFRRIVQKVLAADALLAGRTRASGGDERWADTFANEELLYLVVDGSYVGGVPAIETFAASEIADKDGDGLNEFIDAWGNPLRWIRWPGGVTNRSPFSPDPLNITNPIGTDPLDPTQADVGYDPAQNALPQPEAALPGFTPRPMVVSAGPDGRFGIRFFSLDPQSVASSPIASPIFSPSRVTLLPNGTIPRAPGYWPSAFNWPDPFYPRVVGSFSPSQTALFRRGAILDASVDTVHDPVGVDLNVSPPVFLANPTTDDRYARHAQDNVSNLDEAGAAL